jgi:hypothetical protein
MYNYSEVEEAIEVLINDNVNVKDDETVSGWADFVSSNQQLFPTVDMEDDELRYKLYKKLEADFSDLLQEAE